MVNVFVVSDTWFNRLLTDDKDTNVIEKNNRIIESWNEVVDLNDTVYVLGGFGISDLYNIVVRLNGRICFLDNYFNADEKKFITDMMTAVEKSGDDGLKRRITFESKQILSVDIYDSVFSYYPLSDWGGKKSGTYLFHGLNDNIEMKEHNFSCVYNHWNKPVNIFEIQEKMKEFKIFG